MPKQLYLMDTVNSIRNYDAKYEGNQGLGAHTFNVLFPLRFPIRNIKSITLKSVEMPYRLLNSKSDNGTKNFNIKFSYGAFVNALLPISLSEKQYTDIDELISRINNEIILSKDFYGYTGLNITFSAVNVQFPDRTVAVTHNCSYIEIEKTPFTVDVLGFNNRLSMENVALYGVSPINLYAKDPCLYMNITNLPIMNNNTPSYYTFKIPLDPKSISNNILYYNDPYENQTIYFNDSNFVLDKINVNVCDRYGYQLTGYYNWSFTLIIDYDEDNNKTVEFLNLNN